MFKKNASLSLLLYPALSLSLTLTACAPQSQPVAPTEIAQGQQTEQVQLTVQLPAQLTQEFQTQFVEASTVKYILLSLTGEGVDGTRINREGLVPVEDNTATATINNVPLQAGKLRVVTAQGYDENQNPLPAFVAKGYYTSQSGQTQINIRVDRRGLLIGQILEYLITNDPDTLQQISLNALVEHVDQMTGFNPETGKFTTDPTLFDPVGIAQLLIQNPDATLNEIQNEVQATAGQLPLSIQTKGGGIFTEALRLRIDDPNSSVATLPIGTNSPHIPNLDISQGEWTATLTKQDGTVLGKTSIQVDAEGNVTLGQNIITVQLMPQVTSLNPQVLPVTGNAQIVLTGTGFTDASAVKFGSTDATSFVVDSDTQITATAPAMAVGNVNITVTTPGGTSATANANQATYVNVPTLTQLNPNSGSISDSITLTGTDFNAAHGNNTVNFGSTPATPSAGSNTSLTVNVPTGISGIVQVTVVSNQQTSNALNFSVVPKVTSLGTNTGGSSGGTPVVLTGSGFTGATAVKFGTTDATSFVVNSNTQITATSPAGNPGIVNIRVTTPGGTSSSAAGNRFTYQPSSSALAGSGTGGFADGSGSNAQFSFPWGITRDTNNHLFVSDFFNNSVRQITPAGVVSTFAGSLTQLTGSTNATGSAARFNGPRFIASDPSNNLYVTDINNAQVRKITSAGVVSLLAGSVPGDIDATGSNARFSSSLQGIALDQNQNVYVMDSSNIKVKKITPAGVVTTVAGNGNAGADNGPGANATFSNSTADLAIDSNNNIYVADSGNHCIRKIDGTTQVVSTVAGLCGSGGNTDGIGSAARFDLPSGLAFDADGNLWVSDLGSSRIRKIILATGEVSTIQAIGDSLVAPIDLVFDSSGNLYITGYNQKIVKWTFATP